MIVYGSNHDVYQAWVANAPSPDGKNAERRYIETENNIPSDWNSIGCYTRYATVSLRPNPADLLNGVLDAKIRYLITTMPDHAELTVWHEAQNGNPMFYPADVNAPNVRQMHAHMQALCTSTANADGGRVKYGCIVTGPVAHQLPWLGLGLDWYGVDIYDGPHFRNPDGTVDPSLVSARMDQNLLAWQSVATAGQPVSVRITETNSNSDANRAPFMQALSAWMAANNGHRIVTFWRRGGPLSGPWPPSAATRAAYRQLQADYGA